VRRVGATGIGASGLRPFDQGLSEDLEPFRATHSTFLVDGLDAFRLHLVQFGAQIFFPSKGVPVGRNMRVRHPDGLVAEYVEYMQTTTKAVSA